MWIVGKIYDDAKSYNIYMGEFVKAVLKIVNICNELEKVCSIVENVKLMHTLCQVKEKVFEINCDESEFVFINCS